MQHDQMDNVLRLIRLMLCSENKLDQITISNALGACAHLATVEMGNQVHGCAVKMGLEVDLSVANSLTDMYAKCRSLKDSQKLFKLMSNPDVISWSSLIVGHAHFGYGNEALELFSDVRHLGIKPNHVTFVGVLSACCCVGLADEGFRYYKAMEAEHGIVPMREHCSCMVDLLARAGRLREAERFINQMPFDPDIVGWKTLLSACRTHGDVQVGKRVAENILKLDPSNSAAHVLLCNIYEKLMKGRGVRNHPGQSWIEIRDKVHVCLVEDKSHPEADEIYGMLGELHLQMREAGYIPSQKISFEQLLA